MLGLANRNSAANFFMSRKLILRDTRPPPLPPPPSPPLPLRHSCKLQLKGLHVTTPCIYIEDYCSTACIHFLACFSFCPCSVFEFTLLLRKGPQPKSLRIFPASYPTFFATGGKLNSDTCTWQISSVFNVLDRWGFGFGGRWSTTRTTFLSTSLYGVLNLTRQKQLGFSPIFYPWDTFCLISKRQVYRYTYEGKLKGCSWCFFLLKSLHRLKL